MGSNGGRREGLSRTRGRYCGGALACELVIAFARVKEGRDYMNIFSTVLSNKPIPE